MGNKHKATCIKIKRLSDYIYSIIIYNANLVSCLQNWTIYKIMLSRKNNTLVSKNPGDEKNLHPGTHMTYPGRW